MTETDVGDPHAIVLAADYRVADPERLWDTLSADARALEDMGAHSLVLYTARNDPGRVFVTIGIRDRRPVDALMRSAKLLEWFDAIGVEEIPPVFAGQVLEKIELVDDEPAGNGVIVAAIAEVSDIGAVHASVHARLDSFADDGVRRVWMYRALDDRQEVMILQEIASELDAARWVRHPDAAAEWMDGTGVGIYPPVFVGDLSQVLTLPEPLPDPGPR